MHSLRGDASERIKKGVALLVLATALGCTAQTNQVATGDPLFGDKQPQPGLAPPQPANTPQRTQTPVPPVPTASVSTTNAALASATPLPGSRPPLAIPDNRPAPPPATNTPQLAANQKPPPPKVMPLPREGTTPNLGAFASAPNNPPAPQVNTVANELQAALRARGVLFQKHDSVPQGVRFECIVPSRQNPNTQRFYEATARDYPTAVQAVLKQIDEQR